MISMTDFIVKTIKILKLLTITVQMQRIKRLPIKIYKNVKVLLLLQLCFTAVHCATILTHTWVRIEYQKSTHVFWTRNTKFSQTCKCRLHTRNAWFNRASVWGGDDQTPLAWASPTFSWLLLFIRKNLASRKMYRNSFSVLLISRRALSVSGGWSWLLRDFSDWLSSPDTSRPDRVHTLYSHILNHFYLIIITGNATIRIFLYAHTTAVFQIYVHSFEIFETILDTADAVFTGEMLSMMPNHQFKAKKVMFVCNNI